MSYSFDIGVTPVSELDAAIETRSTPFLEGRPVDEQDAVTDHLRFAARVIGEAAKEMGSPDAVRVAISGHANPGHAPREGWSDEHLTISVAAVREQPDSETATQPPSTEDGGAAGQPAPSTEGNTADTTAQTQPA